MSQAEDKLLDTLRTLLQLFERYNYRGGFPASFMQELINLREVGSPELFSRLNGLEMWGGMGALWDFESFQYWSPEMSDQEAHNALVIFRQLMVLLVDQMEQEGLLSDKTRVRAQHLAQIVRTWNARDL